jgi:type II secretory pathway component PulJ
MRIFQKRVLSGGRSEGGFTLLEAVISVSLIVVVLQVMAGISLLVSRSGRFGKKQAHVLAQCQHVLQRISNEVRTSSVDTDPVTGQPYLSITGLEGDREMTFRRVVSFGDNGGELVPVWSSEILYRLEETDLVREQDGDRTVLLRNVEWLGFEVDGMGRVAVQLVNQSIGGETSSATASQEIKITPMM